MNNSEIKYIASRSIKPENAWLLQHRYNVTSQTGDDGIIAKIFEIISEHGSTCVEFGAWDGIHYSNTYNLISSMGWSGYLIEANKAKFAALQNTYESNKYAVLINWFVRLNKGEGTLDEILCEYNCPINFDLLSIDIDGNDYYVWEGMTNFFPKVVVIEFNPSIPNDVVFVQKKSFEVNQGCSLLALVMLAEKKDYKLVCANEFNAFFVRNEYYQRFNIPDNSPDALYVPPMNGRIFHGYDGTIHVVGMPHLIWHGIKLTDSDFQVLPKSPRHFSDAQR